MRSRVAKSLWDAAATDVVQRVVDTVCAVNGVDSVRVASVPFVDACDPATNANKSILAVAVDTLCKRLHPEFGIQTAVLTDSPSAIISPRDNDVSILDLGLLHPDTSEYPHNVPAFRRAGLELAGFHPINTSPPVAASMIMQGAGHMSTLIVDNRTRRLWYIDAAPGFDEDTLPPTWVIAQLEREAALIGYTLKTTVRAYQTDSECGSLSPLLCATALIFSNYDRIIQSVLLPNSGRVSSMFLAAVTAAQSRQPALWAPVSSFRSLRRDAAPYTTPASVQHVVQLVVNKLCDALGVRSVAVSEVPPVDVCDYTNNVYLLEAVDTLAKRTDVRIAVLADPLNIITQVELAHPEALDVTTLVDAATGDFPRMVATYRRADLQLTGLRAINTVPPVAVSILYQGAGQAALIVDNRIRQLWYIDTAPSFGADDGVMPPSWVIAQLEVEAAALGYTLKTTVEDIQCDCDCTFI